MTTAAYYGSRGPRTRAESEHRFFTGYAIAAAVLLLLGFAPSYLLPLAGFATGQSRLMSPLVHLHGALFFGYLALYVGQTLLAGSGRIHLHRQIGILGAPVLVALLVVGSITGLQSTARSADSPQALAFLAWLIGDILMIAVLMGAALHFRREPAAHKRLMALTMAVMMGPGLGRIIMWLSTSSTAPLWLPPTLFGMAIVIWDLGSRGRVHWATRWGFGALVASQAIRLAVMALPGWPPVAKSIVVALV